MTPLPSGLFEYNSPNPEGSLACNPYGNNAAEEKITLNL